MVLTSKVWSLSSNQQCRIRTVLAGDRHPREALSTAEGLVKRGSSAIGTWQNAEGNG
jgi:hypothetical protein